MKELVELRICGESFNIRSRFGSSKYILSKEHMKPHLSAKYLLSKLKIWVTRAVSVRKARISRF